MMIVTECPSADELHALSTGQLADERDDELLEHIRGCEACRSTLETVVDAEDSLIASLRSPDALAVFDAEPQCKVAVLKAIGALAQSSQISAGGDAGYVPKSIGEYEIVRPLGRGGMGSVFLARHTKLGREVALKVLAGHRLADVRMRERFEAEMRAVGKLSHPNVVTAHDAREVDGTAVLVTEFIDGFDLSQLVQRTGLLGTADACEIGRQVAVAIAYTSQQGFVHRDIKPSNIMLSRNGEVKLLDLGLAKLQVEDIERVGMTGTGQTMGTADYVAPEQVTDSRSVDARTDIYSLGCTLFKLLTGVAPFADAEHTTAFAKMTAHVSKHPPSLAERLADAPAGLVKLVDSMLAKHPAKRPQTPEAVAEKLAPFTHACDLKQLVGRAETLELTESHSAGAPKPSSAVVGGTTPLLRRGIPMWVAIGSAIAGLLLGLCLGIVIKIEYPDGTVLSIPLPSGSKLTLEDSSQTEVASDPVEALQGLWRSVSQTIRGEEKQSTNLQLLWAFDETTFYVCTARGPSGGGTFSVSTEGRHKSIDFRDEVRRQERYPMLRGIYRMRSDGRLEIHSNINLLGPRPSSFDVEDPSATVGVTTLERLGDLPRTPEEARAMSNGKDEELSQAIMTMLDVAHVRPKFLEPLSLKQSEAAAKQEKTRNNLKTIGLAFHSFHSTCGKFPGSSNMLEDAGTVNEKPIPPVSWRVAILPYIGENELYQQYRFHEPWDSEHNQTLLDKMPEVYRSPYWADVEPIPVGETHYQGFVGEQTALGTEDGVPMREFTDGTSPTLLIAETRSTVPWMKPQDIAFEKPEDAKRATPFENTPLNFVTADGAVHSMNPIDWEKLPKLITRNGGERVELEKKN